MIRAARSPAAERARAIAALHVIPAGCDRATWVRVGMAVKAAGLDFDQFDAWSETADNYGGTRETRSMWDGLRADGGIGAATLFHVAREHGWNGGIAGYPMERRPDRSQLNKHAAPSPMACKPIPYDAPPPPPTHRLHGTPSVTWTYRDEEGGALFHMCRFDTGDGEKVFMPLTFDGTHWRWKGPLAPRPLYGLDRLAAKPDAPVIVCEGEKAADAAAGLIPDAVAVTSPNGAQGARQANWSPLAGRRVLLWPDFDAPGDAFARAVAELLAQAGATVCGVIDVRALSGDRDLPQGWDAADAVADGLPALCWKALPLVFANDNVAQVRSLNEPLNSPEVTYHPLQIARKKHKETGDLVFSGALGTAENLSRLVSTYAVRIRYNELSREIEISVGGKLPNGDLARNESLSLIEDLCRINHYPYTAAAGHLDRLAMLDRYNPALDWIKSSHWNGGEHLRALFDCLTLPDESKAEISWILFRKWFLGAVAILSGKTRKFEHVLVLADPQGGIGKTRFFNTLCPKEFQADGVTLNTDDKDSVLQVVSKWLVELGEIGATFSRSDIESFKAFLSRDTDELRPAYARAANRYQRRTAFFGSVNNVRFLVDDTNNRRFWPIEVSAIDYRHSIDMQQVWAEALHRVEAGETWHLDAHENLLIGEHNESFRSMDRVEESILTMYDARALPSRYLSASQVLEEIGLLGAKLADTRRAGTILRKQYAHRRRNNVVVYHMPFPLSRASHLTPVRSD